MSTFHSASRRSIFAYPSFALALTIASASYAGPTWDGDETSDAGASASTAQTVTQTGTVLEIKGRLSSTAFTGDPDFADMFLIQITAPTMLSISTAGGDGGGYAQFDSQLFLFKKGFGPEGTPRALGVLGNGDASQSTNGAFLSSHSNDGSQFVLTEPGFYYIAIALAGVNPLSGTQRIWPNMSPGVIGFGNFMNQSGWSIDPSTMGGEYSMRVTGIEGVPAPGALALLGLAGLIRRRRIA